MAFGMTSPSWIGHKIHVILAIRKVLGFDQPGEYVIIAFKCIYTHTNS
jgi:hypothetical protein